MLSDDCVEELLLVVIMLRNIRGGIIEDELAVIVTTRHMGPKNAQIRCYNTVMVNRSCCIEKTYGTRLLYKCKT